MAITFVHSNPVSIDRGVMTVDRKFHVGMLCYASSLDERLLTINPVSRPDQPIMDPIELVLKDLPYDVLPMAMDDDRMPLPSDLAKLRAQVARSALVYGGDLGVVSLCRELRVPYILILEYDLQTQIAATTLQVTSRVRRIVRSARCAWRHFSEGIPEIRAAHSVHCNGFPVYESARRYNEHCLLYFDSRMSSEMLIGVGELQDRCAGNEGRPLRLLYSGRYESFKGALDVLRIGAECIERGLDIDLHCYGQGSLRDQMLQIAARRPDRLHVHDAIPYPDLVKISRSFDLFVCCHVQNDPSCTYLEAMGAGLPVTGYANAMWRDMCEASRAGRCSKMGSPGGVADSIDALYHDRAALADLSVNALAFASEHLFEAEFDKRIAAIKAAASQCAARNAVAAAGV